MGKEHASACISGTFVSLAKFMGIFLYLQEKKSRLTKNKIIVFDLVCMFVCFETVRENMKLGGQRGREDLEEIRKEKI